MKKTVAILLIFVMLLPMVLVSNAEEAKTEIRPFTLVNWSYPVAGYTDGEGNITGMPFLWCYPIKEGDTSIRVSIGSESGKTYDIKQGAKNVKEMFDRYPEGARYLNLSCLGTAFRGFVEDVIFMDKGVKMVQDWLNSFLTEFKAIGGKLDGIAVDLEYNDGYSWYISSKLDQDNLLFHKIVSNPLYKTKVRPELEKRGFVFYPNPNEYMPEIYSIYTKSGSEYEVSRNIWDKVIRNLLNDYITEAAYETMIKYYPDGYVSDYKSTDSKAWLTDSGGVSVAGNGVTAGNTSNMHTYSQLPGKNFFYNSNGEPIYSTLPGYYKAVYENGPFSMFQWDMNMFKNRYSASQNGLMSAWVTYYYYADENKNSVSNTPYYAETILHMGMLDPKPFLGYIIPSETGSDENYRKCLEVFSDILDELTRLVGAADRKPIYIPATWNSSFVLSGMYAGGKNVWRITPDTTKGMTLEAFKVEGENPTFSIDGQTVTFPQGKIIADGKVAEVGTCGYWVETPVDVYPVITSLANRYSEYPAFVEDYEGYAPDTELQYANAKPLLCWDITKKKGSTATVVTDKTDAENQVLALQGTFKLTNVNLPKNITAGDTYAEDQTWEIMVTLPADMSAEAEVTLLNCKSGNKTDGGLKISGGKVWYEEGEEYKEIADLDVSAGGKFLVKRVVNFNGTVTVTEEDGTEKTEPAYTSSYYIYDANGEVVGKAENVPMGIKTVPVEGIGVTCTNITGEPILLDNFKLYQSGVAADLGLYDAATGIKVTDMEQARAEDTAYRLSWLNATNMEKVYSVVAAYYDAEGNLVSEQVVEELKMAPGTDGVATAVVKNETEGQTLLIYLRDDNVQEGTDPLVTVVTVVAMVVVCLLVLVAVAANVKKPKATANEPEEPENTEKE